jgi:hypothetical protein
MLSVAQDIVIEWQRAGHRRRLGPNHVVLQAAGPSKDGYRTVVAIYADGRVMVPFSSYAGMNSGIPVESLMTSGFRAYADELFGFNGTEKQARTVPGWLARSSASGLLEFCLGIADAYAREISNPPVVPA